MSDRQGEHYDRKRECMNKALMIIILLFLIGCNSNYAPSSIFPESSPTTTVVQIKNTELIPQNTITFTVTSLPISTIQPTPPLENNLPGNILVISNGDIYRITKNLLELKYYFRCMSAEVCFNSKYWICDRGEYSIMYDLSGQQPPKILVGVKDACDQEVGYYIGSDYVDDNSIMVIRVNVRTKEIDRVVFPESYLMEYGFLSVDPSPDMEQIIVIGVKQYEIIKWSTNERTFIFPPENFYPAYVGLWFSPVSKALIFGYSTVPGNEFPSTVYIADDITQTPLFLANAPEGTLYEDAAWSPDASKFALTAQSSEYIELCIIKVKEEKQECFPLSDNIYFYSNLAWSPDSRYIALVRYKKDIIIFDTLDRDFITISLSEQIFLHINYISLLWK
jgi:WD40 repeat protein